MSPEVIQIVVPLTFIGICGLAGEILVQGRRDKTAEERLQMLLRGKRNRTAQKKPAWAVPMRGRERYLVLSTQS